MRTAISTYSAAAKKMMMVQTPRWSHRRDLDLVLIFGDVTLAGRRVR